MDEKMTIISVLTASHAGPHFWGDTCMQVHLKVTWRRGGASVSCHDDGYIRVRGCCHSRACAQQVAFRCCGRRCELALGKSCGSSCGSIRAGRTLCPLRDLVPRILCQVRRCWGSSMMREGGWGQDRGQSTTLTYNTRHTSSRRDRNKWPACFVYLIVSQCSSSQFNVKPKDFQFTVTVE